MRAASGHNPSFDRTSRREGLRYVSQVAKLCGPKGCRRLPGENLPEDLLAVDYDPYSVAGSIFAVRTIITPVMDAELARPGKT